MSEKAIYDLHTHSNLSDGSLSPAGLIELARENGVTHLAITDHDTVAAYDKLPPDPDITLLAGIELSCLWQGRSIHIVGLNINLESDVIKTAVNQQAQARHKRAEMIAAKLSKAGIKNTLEQALCIAGEASIGRPHFAQCLVDMGIVNNKEKAFRKYLGAGKPGDIKQQWPDLETVLAWIKGAGGTGVIAHPLKYRMTRSKLMMLVEEFKHFGGSAIEVCSGFQDKPSTSSLARLCRETGLMASTGSDFHHPQQKWALPGKQSALPQDCRPVWECWQ